MKIFVIPVLAAMLSLAAISDVFFTSSAESEVSESICQTAANDAEPTPMIVERIQEPDPVAEMIFVEEPETVSAEDIDLLALVTMAEAEGECEEGQRLVIDTILNRVDNEHFPDTVYEVVYQPNQFSSMWNGRVERCYVTEEIVRLVHEELETRTNSDVIFFRAGRYSDYGAPLFQVDHHYFSSYE